VVGGQVEGLVQVHGGPTLPVVEVATCGTVFIYRERRKKGDIVAEKN
jgi:hypothetical protein